jgi:hypothetical protein
VVDKYLAVSRNKNKWGNLCLLKKMIHQFKRQNKG